MDEQTYMDSYMAYNGYYYMVYPVLSLSPPQRGESTTKVGDHDTSKISTLDSLELIL
jgi:hypothetical protein